MLYYYRIFTFNANDLTLLFFCIIVRLPYRIYTRRKNIRNSMGFSLKTIINSIEGLAMKNIIYDNKKQFDLFAT